MYSTPENYETIMSGARNIWYEGTITTVAGDVYEFDASNIVTGTGSINRRITDGTSLAIGSVTAAQFDIKLYWQNIDRYELYDAEISVTCYIGNGDQSPIEIPMGIFYINEVTQDATTVSITAYDAMLKFDALYIHTVANKTPYEWLTAWCSTCEVELGSTVEQIRNMPNGTLAITLDIDSVSDVSTFRDALSYLCTVLCAVAVIGRDGKLYIMNYGTTPAKTFNQSQRYSSTLSDYVCYYTHLTAVYGETVENYVDTSYSGEDDGIALDIDVNPFLQIADADTRNAACQAILTKLASVHYAPYEVSLPARPELDIMDVIGFTGGQADAQDFGAIMDITYNFHSSMSISCAGDNPKTIKENKYVKTIKNVSRLAKQNDDFAGLLANAYGMFRTEIEDPVIEGAYAYALHNASTYNTSTFAVLLDADGLFMLTRDTVYDDWDIASITASDGAALIETLTANSAIIDTLLSRDVTVTGSLHSDDYVPAATGASPPYSQVGMGLDFGEKEFEAEHFAIDADGRMWASEGHIGKWQIVDDCLFSEAQLAFTAEEKAELETYYHEWYPSWVCGDTYGVRMRLYPPEAYPSDVPINISPVILVEKQAYHDATHGEGSGPRLEWFECFYVDTNGKMWAAEGRCERKFSSYEINAYTYTSPKSPSGLTGVPADNNFIAEGSTGCPSFRARRVTNYGVGDVALGIGSGGENHGVYSGTLNRWMLFGDSTDVYYNGLIYPNKRLAFAKSLTQEDVGTSATHFVTLTSNWGKFGYSTVAQVRTLLNVFANTTPAGSNSFIIDSDGSTVYRFVFTNAGNLRLDTSTDGGTNWTTQKYVLWNSQTGIAELYSGTFKSGSAAATFSRNYDFYIIYGSSGGGARESVVIPKACIGTSNTAVLISDDESWLSVNLKYSGSTITMSWKENKKTGGTTLTSGFINRVYGVVGLK